MPAAIQISRLDIVFGQHNLAQSLRLLDAGKSRAEISQATTNIVGVQNANLSVEHGEICVLMGLSGSGKSTLLRAVNGLNRITRGQLWVQHQGSRVNLAHCDRKTLRRLRRYTVSMVFQKFALMPWLTVVENVAFGLAMQAKDKPTRRALALEKLALVGLVQWANQYPHALSGGMQQRVGLARALAMDSDILLMDEPFSALDPLIRNQLQDELLVLQQQLQKTIIFVSHDLDEALKLGNRIAIMDAGKIVQHGDPAHIVLNPINQYVRDFVSHTNPLNVLRGEALMTQAQDLARTNHRVQLNEYVWITLNAHDGIVGARKGKQALPLSWWQPGHSMEALDKSTLVCCAANISMRQAIEICYRTSLPIALTAEDKFVGCLTEANFYHALLGKHH